MNSALSEPTAATILGQGDIAFQANLYDDPNPTRRSLHRQRRSWVERQLDRYAARGVKALEIGVGCGVFTRYLAQNGAEVTAVDINQAFLEGVRSVGGVTTLAGDATRDLGLRNMDIALLSEVLEHVPPERSQAMLDEIYRALNPGGVLIFSTPQRYSTMERTAALLSFPPLLALARKIYGTVDELGHINLLTRNQLKRQIRATGFEIVEEEMFGFYLPVLAEFGGKLGADMLNAVGRGVRRVPVLNHLVWTQAYVLRKPVSSA